MTIAGSWLPYLPTSLYPANNGSALVSVGSQSSTVTQSACCSKNVWNSGARSIAPGMHARAMCVSPGATVDSKNIMVPQCAHDPRRLCRED